MRCPRSGEAQLEPEPWGTSVQLRRTNFLWEWKGGCPVAQVGAPEADAHRMERVTDPCLALP